MKLRDSSGGGDLIRRRRLAHAWAAASLAVCILLLVFPPEHFRFYPQCPVQRYLHFACPGCGAMRALAALLHGRVREALRDNALFVLLLPFGAAYAGTSYRRAGSSGEFHWPTLPAPLRYAAFAAAAAFTLLRAGVL